MNRPTITVLGATGAQGGGVVQALLADPGRSHAVRAVTRRPQGAAAARLRAAGCEVVQADLDDRASLCRAFAGTHGVFAVTNFWEHMSPERELRQVENIAAAAASAEVAHLVWSTLEDVRKYVALTDPRLPTLRSRWKVPHFDAKGEGNRRFLEHGVPTTFLHTSFFWENFIHFGLGPRRSTSGDLVLALPMGERPLPGIAAGDIGAVAVALFACPGEALGRSIGIAGEHLTGAQMAAALGRAIGEPIRYAPPTWSEFAAQDLPGADDLANMFAFKHDFNKAFCALRDVEVTRRLHPALSSFDAWLERHAARIPIPPPVQPLPPLRADLRA